MTKREYQLADYLAEKARVDSAPDRAAVPVTADFMAWDSRIAGHDPKLASRLQNVNAPLAKTRKQEWDALLAVRKAGYEHGKDDGFGHGLLLGIPIGILLLFTALCFWYGC